LRRGVEREATEQGASKKKSAHGPTLHDIPFAG